MWCFCFVFSVETDNHGALNNFFNIHLSLVCVGGFTKIRFHIQALAAYDWFFGRFSVWRGRERGREIVIEEHHLIEQSHTLHAPDARCLVCCVDTFIYSFIMFGFCLIYSHFVTWSAIRKWYSVFCINDMMIYQKDCQFSLALARTSECGSVRVCFSDETMHILIECVSRSRITARDK